MAQGVRGVSASNDLEARCLYDALVRLRAARAGDATLPVDDCHTALRAARARGDRAAARATAIDLAVAAIRTAEAADRSQLEHAEHVARRFWEEYQRLDSTNGDDRARIVAAVQNLLRDRVITAPAR